jgi:hypothetical protein
MEEEVWFAEEPTIVYYDVQDVVESRDDITDKYVLLHGPNSNSKEPM